MRLPLAILTAALAAVSALFAYSAAAQAQEINACVEEDGELRIVSSLAECGARPHRWRASQTRPGPRAPPRAMPKPRRLGGRVSRRHEKQ